MEDSMAQGSAVPATSVAEGWRHWVGTTAAAVLAILFIAAGIWKLSDPLATQTRMVQALIPQALSLPIALAAGIFETWAGVLLLVPRWRKWGAWISGLMLAAFMVYFAIFYDRLQGADCSCFPWLKRVVGPGFFISDGIMLALAGLAAWWSARSQSGRQALMALAIVAVSAGVLYGVTASRQTGVMAPPEISVDGKPLSLHQGRVLVYFFDPECMHCFSAAKSMGVQQWNEVKLIAVPTVNPQWAVNFLGDTGLKAGVSFDQKILREKFQFTDPPYAVAIENGRLVRAFPFFDEKEPMATLKSLGWVR